MAAALTQVVSLPKRAVPHARSPPPYVPDRWLAIPCSQSQPSTSASRQSAGSAQICRATLFGIELPNIELPSFGGPSPSKRPELKQKLLDLISTTKRGAEATEEQILQIEEAVQALEKVNPNKAALASPLLNGKWELVYTTSSSVVGSSKPAFLRPSGPIYQYIDAPNGKGKNTETAPFFNSVTADLTPTSPSRVDVRFRQFKILGLLPVTAPESAVGWLDTTYLDEEMRISRGDKGNLFVLLMDTPGGFSKSSMTQMQWQNGIDNEQH